MNILIIFDSQFGNTQIIAQAIASGLKNEKLKIVAAENASTDDLKNVDLLIVGSPTQGGRAKQNLQEFLDQIPAGSLKNVKFAAFDTRFDEKNVGLGLKLLMKTIGYAAPKISELLKSKGGTQVADPEGFIVTEKKGPLADGEEKRAKEWAQKFN